MTGKIALIILAVLAIISTLICLAACKVSGDCSREEEAEDGI